ncbi:MAG: MMPL family transporter [Spirochaetes bacterium]|nr:MMPL family transporter [Spirochaetota bacterium]
MKWLVRLSINRPRTVIACIVAVTVFFGIMLATRFSINVDPMKSFSRKMDVIKYYHLTLKKFSMKDMILIGVENDKKGIFNVETLRYVEEVSRRFQDLAVSKTYHNIITGEKETVEVPSQIATGQIMSVINADDVMVDRVSNTIVVGNLTSKARKKAGLLDPDPEKMKKLPGNDGDLEKMIPYLKKELMGNELLKGTLFSADGTSCTIMVPVEKRLDNKLEIIRREMPLMVNADALRDRFSGRDYYFKGTIYGKTVAGTTVDDRYIEKMVAGNRKKVRSFFLDTLSPICRHYGDFYADLRKSEVDGAYLDRVFMMIEKDEIYERSDVDITYQDLIDDIYAFVIDHMDRFSRNNLESKLYNVTNIYDVGYLYKLFIEISEKNKPSDLTIYIAGRPIAEALLEEFVVNDMSIFMTITTLVILLILFLSIRTTTGMFLPLATVVISITCLMGGMLMAGIEFSSGTIAMPSILIAVGSSYVIHYLIRYYEKAAAAGGKSVKEALIETTDSIDVAINLSAVTTITAFLSVITIDVIDIQRLGLLVSMGIVINLLLTYTFIPAVLSLLPMPEGIKETRLERAMMKVLVKGGENTARHSRAVFFGALGVAAFFFVGLFFLKTESSITFMFLESNPILKADRFINRELTGTGQMCIVFKMRDEVDLSSPQASGDLARRIDAFTSAYRRFQRSNPALGGAPTVDTFIVEDLEKMKNDVAANREAIRERVDVFTDIMNEYYEFRENRKNGGAGAATEEVGDDLGAMADDYEKVSGIGAAVTPQEAGIERIVGRVTSITTEREKEQAARFIRSIREQKRTAAGKEFQGAFYYLSDFFHTDITQPVTLRKLELLGRKLKELKEPKAVIGDVEIAPVGNIMSITDTLKLIYRVFYHDDNTEFHKIPDVSADGIQDKSLTDRSIIGVCLSQFQASREDVFRYLVADDYKLMQYVVFMRSDKADFLREFEKQFYRMAREVFPKNDPYVERIVISGLPAINLRMNESILVNQIQSVILTVFVVFLACVFIFRSIIGGIFAAVPISFTVIITLGVMGFLGFPINYSTLINASLAIGAGIDYCIHFMERFKYEHITKGYDFEEAYRNTLQTTGLAIVISTVTVGLGFAVLGFSSFKIIRVSGLLVTLSMVMAGTMALTVLPAMINWLKPEFLNKMQPFALEDRVREIVERVWESLRVRFPGMKN